LKRLKSLLKSSLIWLAVGLFLLEELIWVKGQQLVARAFVKLHITWFLSRIPKASKWESIGWMSVPFLVVLPFKLAAVGFFAQGHAFFGILTYIGAKITSTALIGRVYSLAQAKLRLFPVFDWLHLKVSSLNYKVKTWLHAQPAYITVKALKERIKAQLKADPNSTMSRAQKLFKSTRQQS
jgi:hypothetical protein